MSSQGKRQKQQAWKKQMSGRASKGDGNKGGNKNPSAPTKPQPTKPTAKDPSPTEPVAKPEPIKPLAKDPSPIEPTVKPPTQPTAEESAPTKPPTEPSAKPQPTQPTAEESAPTKPTAEESAPTKPTAEESAPTKPTAEESAPTKSPTEPTAKPEPTKPTAKEEPPPKPALLDPVLSWDPPPAPILVGTPLSEKQLSAKEASGAKLKFTPDEGEVLKAGDGQTLKVEVIDPRFKPGTLTRTIDVKRKTRTLVWEAANPLEVELKVAIRAEQIKAKYSEGEGEPACSQKAGDTFAKKNDNLVLTVTGEATDEYDAPEPLAIPIVIVLKPQPFEWDQAGKTPAITYGAKLSPNFFKAAVPSNKAAKIVYKCNGMEVTPDKILDAAVYDFTATSPGSQQFAPTTLTAKLTVRPNQSLITWADPPDIEFGTKLTKAAHQTAKLTRPADAQDQLVYDPPEGTELPIGPQELKVTFPGNTNFAKLPKTVHINVTKAKQTIDWPQPADITFPAALGPAQKTAVITKGNVGATLVYTCVPHPPKVGKVKLTAKAPGNDNYEETSKEVEITILPPAPPTKPANTQAKRTAGISADMEKKITSAEPKPGAPGKVRGGHSPKILADKTKTTYDPQVLATNEDGTKSVKFKMKLPDGTWSDPKTSTVAPENWDDEAMMGATIEVGKVAATFLRPRDQATLHRKKVNGVEWEVIKDRNGNVTMSIPTGGTPTSYASFIG